MGRLHDKMSLKQVLAALGLAAVFIFARAKGGAWEWSVAFLLKTGAFVLFLFFSLFFFRAVHHSVKTAPRYAVPAYALLTVSLLCWFLAFFYPFPVQTWQDVLWRDIAFFAGAPGPLVILILLAAGKVIVHAPTRDRFRKAFSRIKVSGGGLLTAALMLWFFAFCASNVVNDLKDLQSGPAVRVDTLTGYSDTARATGNHISFGQAGKLHIPHGVRPKDIRKGERYKILYAPHRKMLLALKPVAGDTPKTTPRGSRRP